MLNSRLGSNTSFSAPKFGEIVKYTGENSYSEALQGGTPTLFPKVISGKNLGLEEQTHYLVTWEGSLENKNQANRVLSLVKGIEGLKSLTKVQGLDDLALALKKRTIKSLKKFLKLHAITPAELERNRDLRNLANRIKRAQILEAKEKQKTLQPA